MRYLEAGKKSATTCRTAGSSPKTKVGESEQNILAGWSVELNRAMPGAEGDAAVNQAAAGKVQEDEGGTGKPVLLLGG